VAQSNPPKAARQDHDGTKRIIQGHSGKSLERGDVPNDDDLRNHIPKHITPKLREQVLKHELKWRHQNFSVKVFVPPTLE